MSGMAEEMAARIAADEGAGLPDGAGMAAAPGTETVPPATPPAPPAAESNTDTSGSVPETVPYARFKEVNDRVKAYEGFDTLVEYGYDPDSLGRLAAFEAQYLSDPVGTWAALANNLDLPPGLKEAIETHLSTQPTSTQPGTTAQGEPGAAAPPSSDLDPRVLKLLEREEAREAAEKDASEQALLDSAISHWDKLDEGDKIETPEHMKLALISAVGNSGQVFPTTEALVEAARAGVLDYRSSVLGGAVRTGREGAPVAVPGSAAAASEPVTFGGDIRAATKAAEAAIARGELPN